MTATITERTNNFGHVEYVANGVAYGDRETAERMLAFSEHCREVAHLKRVSLDALLRALGENGFCTDSTCTQERTRSGCYRFYVSNGVYIARLNVEPQPDGSMAHYHIEHIAPKVPDWLTSNETTQI